MPRPHPLRRTALAATLALLAGLPASAADAQARRPVIERVSPTAGPPGIELEVVGRHFVGDATMTLAGRALPVVSRSPNRWTVRVPDEARTGRIVVRTEGGEFRGPEFRVLPRPPAPEVADVRPRRGRPGAEVVIEGSNFSARPGETTVSIGGEAAVVRRATPTRLEVVVPEGAETAPFVVAVRHAGEARTAPFTVDVPTTVTGLDPEVGPAGSRVVVRGTGFSSDARRVRVLFGRRRAQVAEASPRRLVVEVPRGARTGEVVVDVRGAGRAASPSPFRVQPVPEIRGVAPAEAVAGRNVTIRGRYFGNDADAVSVRIGGRPAEVQQARGNELTVEVPDGAATGPVEVSVHGVGPARSEAPFVVLDDLRLTSVEPTSGPPGTVVVVRGAGFSPTPRNVRVTMSGEPLPVVASARDEVRVRVPETASSGALVIQVENGGTGRTTQPFLVTSPPVIAGFEPAQGLVGTEVTIVGAQFGTQESLVTVRLGDRPMPVRSLADDRVVAVVPRGATSGRLTVDVRLQGAATTPAEFTVLLPFAVQRFSPARGYPGQRVTIEGDGFVDGTTVAFPGVRRPVSPVTVEREALRVEVPPRARSGEVVVEVPDGRSRRVGFTVVDVPDGLGIAGVDEACRRPGCAVDVLGWGFGRRGRGARVFWGETELEVSERSATMLRVTLPEATGRNPFRVVVADREAASEPFIVVP